MDLSQISLVTLFAISMVGSPGPANMALMASGAQYGFRASIPFIAGTISGFMLVGLAVAAGLGSLFKLYPLLQTIFLYGSAVYIFYLAWRVVLSNPAAADDTKNPQYILGLFIHPLNPKAWIMAISAFSQFVDTGKPYIVQAFTILAVFFVVNIPLNSMWCYGGNLLRRLIKSTTALRILNGTLALIMVIVVLWVLIDSQQGNI